MFVSHFGFFIPYVPTPSTRAGNPCARGRTKSFMPNAISVVWSIALATLMLSEYPPAEPNATSIASERTPARSRITATGTPVQRAFDMRWAPIWLLMHSSVWYRSTIGRDFRSS